MTELPRRSTDGPFLLSVDHCFPVKGQGTVLTGTVLSGAVKVNDTIELPELKLQKKVKSLQVPITFSTSVPCRARTSACANLTPHCGVGVSQAGAERQARR
jgi:selenocysteine-specific elongation factor